jgi:PII interaction protein X
VKPLPEQKGYANGSAQPTAVGVASKIQNLKSKIPVTSENYLNHPTFGLLYRICIVEENQEIFTTLYAQRMFFLVTSASTGYSFQPVTRSDARLTIDNRIRLLRRNGQTTESIALQTLTQQNFPG